MKRAVIGVPIGRRNKGNLVKDISPILAGGKLFELRV
jgi:hypothetical protein